MTNVAHRSGFSVAALTALCAVSQLFQPAFAAKEDRFAEVRELIRTKMQEAGTPSMAVAISHRGSIVWEGGFGWANKEERVPATEHTMYSLASISKPITATGLMTLVQAKTIDLNAPINDYLGSAKLRSRIDSAQGATVRQVANHAAGLPTYYQFFFADEPYAVPSMEETILRHGELMRPPGERFVYSNLGYGVLDYLIARASKQSFPSFMRQHVFIPLGLTHMSVGMEPAQRRFEAIRYDESGAPIPDYTTDHPGASDIYASAHDLLRFGMFHLKTHLRDQKPILSDASIDEMQRLSFPSADKEAYGIGWRVKDRPDGYRTVEHGGNMPGVNTVLITIPSEQIAAVVLTNAGEGIHRPVAHAMIKVMLPNCATPEESKRKEWPPFSPSPELLGKWQGSLQTYNSNSPVSMEFLADGNIHVQVGNQLKTLVNRPSFADGVLKGGMMGTGRTADAGRPVGGAMALALKLRGAVLNGEVTIMSEGMRSAAMSAWMELKKDDPK